MNLSEVTQEVVQCLTLQSCCFQVGSELLAVSEWSRHVGRHLLGLFFEEKEFYFLSLWFFFLTSTRYFFFFLKY